MARRAHIANLRVADRAHDEVTINGGPTLRADTIVRELMLTQRNVKILLLAIHEIGAWPQDHIRKKAHHRDNRDDCPKPPWLSTTALSVADDINDGKNIEHYNASNYQIEHQTNFRCNNLVQKVGHIYLGLSIAVSDALYHSKTTGR